MYKAAALEHSVNSGSRINCFEIILQQVFAVAADGELTIIDDCFWTFLLC
jgi:hypothetical protein